MVQGRTVEEASRITKEVLTEALGGLPEHKVRCSLTCVDALQSALKSYEGKSSA
jgi:NifU-like protein involved in Fe-S cluster formation